MRIDNDVMYVLGRCTVDANSLTLPEQLDRPLYVKTNKVLEALGAKWNRGAKRHLFSAGTDAGDALDNAIATGEVLLPDSFDFFPTPPDVVEHLLISADIEKRHLVLEPECGDGAIAAAVQEIGAEVRCFEIRPDLAARARARGLVAVNVCDFLQVPPVAMFDRIVMNPPFSKRQEIAHFSRATQWLKPGGTIACVMSKGIVFRTDRATERLRQYIRNSHGSIADLPEGSFRASGTMVNTVIVTARVGLPLEQLCAPKAPTVLAAGVDQERDERTARQLATVSGARKAKADEAARRERQEFTLARTG